LAARGAPGCGRPLDAHACDLNRANSRERPNQFTTSAPSPKFGSQHGTENQMSDPRYQDRVNDPRPLPRGSSDYIEDDTRRGAMWAWIAGIIAVIFVAMLVYGYTRPDTTTASTPTSSSFVDDDRGRPCPEGHPAGARHPAPATPTPATPSPGGNPNSCNRTRSGKRPPVRWRPFFTACERSQRARSISRPHIRSLAAAARGLTQGARLPTPAVATKPLITPQRQRCVVLHRRV